MGEMHRDYVIEFEPNVIYNEDSCEVVFHAKKITPLVKCGECIHRYDPKRQMCTGRKPDFFCADGEKKTEGTEFFTKGHLHLGNEEE